MITTIYVHICTVGVLYWFISQTWEKKPRSTNFSISRCFLSINELNAPEFARGVIKWSTVYVYIHPKYLYSKYQSLSCTQTAMRTHRKASFWSKTAWILTWAPSIINRWNSSRRFKTHSKRTQTNHKRMKEDISKRRSIYRSLTSLMMSMFTRPNKSGHFGRFHGKAHLAVVAPNDASKRSNQGKTRSRHFISSMHQQWCASRRSNMRNHCFFGPYMSSQESASLRSSSSSPALPRHFP